MTFPFIMSLLFYRRNDRNGKVFHEASVTVSLRRAAARLALKTDRYYKLSLLHRGPSLCLPGLPRAAYRLLYPGIYMSTSRQIKLEQQVANQQKGLIGELQALVKDLERCEKTVSSLKVEL